MKELITACGRKIQIDEEFYGYLSQFNWSLSNHGYPHASIANKTVYLHRLIGVLLGFQKSKQVDHKDGNKLNAQKSNLREATQSQNNMNSKLRNDSKSGYKGVYLDIRTMRWVANIWINGHCKFLGRFNTAEEAAKAYDKIAIRQFGEYARTNFN